MVFRSDPLRSNMAELVTFYIDGRAYQVPKGTNLVDAAKMHGIDIPVFCYHPKLNPVGMCRMCLVELGNVSVNRETGEQELDENGQPVIRWIPRLQTACTQNVVEGLAVRTTTDKVTAGRNSILEFLLTSHPLDCPVCDKGGECPLQNLTMGYGPGRSRFIFDDKIRLDKHVPLGELIYLDRERCIQCARCTRFCDEIVGDDVLAFHERGRRLQIVTISDPPFDTKFSGNTTDICPVGALTTADFRFGARPWELEQEETICPYCPVGCNLSASTRLDRDAGGKKIIKRIMPRQNEWVNEIWICDKGRFGHHHSRSEERLTQPLVKQNGEWVAVDWATAYDQIAARLKQNETSLGVLGSPDLSNEDFWELRRLVENAAPGTPLGVWPANMTGGDLVAQVGVGSETRLRDAGPETAILVIASDFEEEAPIWWLQVKQAADRGAKLVVANARPTKLDRFATVPVRYRYGEAVGVLNGFLASAVGRGLPADLDDKRAPGLSQLQSGLGGVEDAYPDASEALLSAENLLIFAGGEGLSLAEHRELMQAAANLLIVTGRAGRKNSGLVAVWPGPNMQGAYDMGFSAEATQALLAARPKMWIIGGANPVEEDPRMAEAIRDAEFVVATAQFMTPTAEAADIVLPRQSFAERSGSFTNGLRRVQRFNPVQAEIGDAMPDWKIFASIDERISGRKAPISAAAVMREINRAVPDYAEASFPRLAQVERQFPLVGGDDLYYGGTSYNNLQGIGYPIPPAAERGDAALPVRPVKVEAPTAAGELTAIPVRLLYDRDPLFEQSELMHQRIPQPYVELSADDAARLGIAEGDRVAVTGEGFRAEVVARVDGRAPTGFVLLPMQLAHQPLPTTPEVCAIQKIGE
jgi:NADH-quinone oxidoreductase subunit G